MQKKENTPADNIEDEAVTNRFANNRNAQTTVSRYIYMRRRERRGLHPNSPGPRRFLSHFNVVKDSE